MSMNMAQRRQALLDIFDKHEEMTMLLACIPRSPALWNDSDAEDFEVKDRLVERGLLSEQDNFVATTPAGRDALIAYINGDDEQEQGDDE